MTVRTDITFDWTVSPRIITILSPSTEIVIQDLLDTCREAEDDIPNMIYKQIISAAGKENLGGGVKVGLTATLLNAVLAFEARPGPSYVQCKVSGGNLVALDEFGVDISPILPTAFTQVLTTSSSSATLQELQDIQYSSFEGQVTVDLSASNTGTIYPVGTGRKPSNNFTDAIDIANERGFSKIFIKGNVTLTSGVDFSDFVFIGESELKTTITIDPSANVLNCEFINCSITGTLDGSCHVSECKILNINYISGVIKNSIIEGIIKLNGDAIIINCDSGDPGVNSYFDFDNTASVLALRNYNGKICLKNKNQPDIAVLDINCGEVVLESTVTSGNIIIRGIGSITDNSVGATVDVSNLINPTNVADTTWNKQKSSFTTPGSLGKELATNKDVITANIVFK